jgi:hypothetical protein
LREKLFFVCLTVAIFLLSVPVWGQTHSVDDTVWISSLSGEAGDTISIPINLKNTFHVGGYLFRITYDTLAFEPISVDTTSRSGGFEWNGFNLDEPGVIRFFATSMHPIQNAIPPGTGPISMVNVFIQEDAPEGIYEIRFENEDTTSYDNQLSDSTGETLIIPVLIDGVVDVSNQTGVDPEFQTPGTFELSQNYPNPFNSGTVISFSLESPDDVELAVYDLLGRKVAVLYSGFVDGGEISINWNGRSDDGSNLSSGVYFYRLLTVSGKSSTRMMVLLK